MEKWEAKKDPLYKASSTKAAIVDVPRMIFASLSGSGDPNSCEGFQRSIEALYKISYGIKMRPKSGRTPPGYFPYVVPPLEGFWDMPPGEDFNLSRKDRLLWQIVIQQPSFVTEDLFEELRGEILEKFGAENRRLEDLRLVTIREGLSCHMLHIGAYDDEPATFAEMERFAAESGYRRTEKSHHEIYLSDFRKVDLAKLRTILRFRVEKTA